MYVCTQHNAKVWEVGTLCESYVSYLDNILVLDHGIWNIWTQNGTRKRLRDFTSFIAI